MSWSAFSSGGRPVPVRPVGRSGSESFGPVDDYFRPRTLGTRSGYRQEPFLQPGCNEFECAERRNFRYTAAMTSSVTGAKRRPSDRPTIARVAAEAGVSVPTVSKVINGRADVSPETRRRVEAVIREQGYHRSDRIQRTAPILELIFHELESEWALEIVRGVEHVAGQHHLAVVLSELHGRRTPGRGWIEGALARHPTGRHRGLQRPQRIGADAAADPRASRSWWSTRPASRSTTRPSIGATNWNGGLTATRHLLGLGHRRIAVVGGPEGILCSRARMDGYRAAMDAAGVPIDPELISHGQFQVEEGVAQGPRAAAPPGPPDGDHRGQRPPGARRLPGRPRGAAAHPGGPERRRLRRPAGRPLGRAAADHDPPAAVRDGRRRRRAGARRRARGAAGPDAGRARHRARRPREHRAAGGAGRLTARGARSAA